MKLYFREIFLVIEQVNFVCSVVMRDSIWSLIALD